MDNEDAKHVILTVRRMVLEGYPYPADTTLDDRYAAAFGLIAGLCTECIQAIQQGRPLRLNFAVGEGEQS